MAMRRLILLAALATMPAQADQLATIRPIAVVEDAVVRLSDLFENAGPRGAAVLGPAPAPGARLVVEAPQLFAIARAWRRRRAEHRGAARSGILEEIGEPHHDILHHGDRADRRELVGLRRHCGKGGEEYQPAHRHHRSRERVESISSLAEMTRLFIS